MEKQNKAIFTESINIAKVIDYADGSIVSRTIRKSDNGNITLFAFDAGQELSEHTSPYDAYVYISDGEAELKIGGEKIVVRAGEMQLMPEDIPHAVKAVKRFKMMLIMIK